MAIIIKRFFATLRFATNDSILLAISIRRFLTSFGMTIIR